MARRRGRGSSPPVDVYQVVTDMVVTALEEGVVPWQQPWRPGLGPANLASGKQYRGINIFLLGMAPHSARWWLTYKQAADLGGNVRKGEHGQLVTLWKRIRVKADEGERADEDGKKLIMLLRYYKVFNVEQCEGDGIAEKVAKREEGLAAGEPEQDVDAVDVAEQLIKEMPARPAMTEGPYPCYVPARDEVKVPHVSQFEAVSAYYATTYHELVHSTGHDKRLARPEFSSGRFGSVKYGREELVAEMGAAMLCAQVGLDSEQRQQQSAGYVGHWLDVIKGDKKLVVSAAGAAHRGRKDG